MKFIIFLMLFLSPKQHLKIFL